MSEKYELSRRKALGGLATIGLAGAGAGLGTSAYFSDEESFANNELTAGELDLAVQANVYEYQGSANDGGQSFGGTVNGGDEVQQVLDDVKPGDYSWGRFCFSIVDNPGYIWAGGELTSNDENTVTEPEAKADGENNGYSESEIDGDGELADAVQGCLFYATPGDYTPSDQGRPTDTGAPGEVILEGSLREMLAVLQTGVPLDGSDEDGRQAFPGDEEESFDDDERCLGFWWEVPTDVGNEIQTDSLTFDLTFYAVQERHNDGSDNPFADVVAAADYHNPSGIANPTDGTLVANISWGDEVVALSFNFQDDDDGVDFADTSDYSATNLPVMIDADENGYTDYQLIWSPNGSPITPLDSAPFAKREHDNSDGSPGAYVEVPTGWTAVKIGNTITWALPRSELGASFKLSTWGSTGGEGPVVEISTDSDNSPEFADSTNYVTVSEP